MSLRNKFRQFSLASIFICFFIPQAQAGFWDDAVNKVKSATEEVISDTVDDMANKDETSSDSSAKESSSTASEEKKQAVKKPASTETPSAVADVQSTTVTETTASQHSDVDIVGLKLGMTQDQVIAALKNHNKSVDITFKEFKVTPNDRKQYASLPDHVQAIDARIGNYTRPNETIIIRFSSPPTNSTVNEIVRSATFSQDILADTVISALKEKYGMPPKKGTFTWGNNGDWGINSNCHKVAHLGDGSYYDSTCNGWELTAFVGTGKEIIGGLTTILIDHGEINRQNLATHDYRAQLKEERRKEKITKASQGSAPTL
ncbi:MAG: hypothetical protein ACJAYG_000729 [Oceanicoccus sp.]|jgi:hypothetical protein